MKFDFTGRRIVVTGATSGIGRKVVEDLLESGATVLGIARREEILKEISESHEKFIGAALDVRDGDKMKIAIEKFAAEHGKLNGAVHSAGIFLSTPLRTYDESVAKEIMDINFWAGMRLMQIVNRKKVAEPCCSNVLIASVAAHVGERSQFAYSASKGALQSAARSLSKEIFQTGARINTVSPGMIETPMTRGQVDGSMVSPRVMERHLLGIGRTQDVSRVILFLLDDESKWITGEDFTIDGGYRGGGTSDTSIGNIQGI